jgi:hypothetical protein
VRMLGGPRNYFEVVDYAYGDPGDRVLAGQRGPNTSAPALESLGGPCLRSSWITRPASPPRWLSDPLWGKDDSAGSMSL